MRVVRRGGGIRLVLLAGMTAGLLGTGGAARAEIVRRCPSGWSTTATPARVIPHRERLNDVVAIGDSTVWAVGTVDDGGSTLTLRFEGVEWKRVDTPSPGAPEAVDSELYHVDASAVNDVWAVGRSGGAPLVLHSNGNAWATVAFPAGGSPVDVAAISLTDAWAVGRSGDAAAIFRWNGSAWAAVSHAAPADTVMRLVTASSANNVWATGTRYDGSFYSPVVQHWDGVSWSLVDVESDALQGFGSISTTGPDDTWFSGQEDNRGVIFHYDGEDTTRTSIGQDGLITAIDAISAAGPSDVWAVGGQGPTTDLTPYTAHWDGTAWTTYPPPIVAGPASNVELRAVDRAPGGAIWAVGDTYLNTVAARRCDGPAGPQLDQVDRLAGSDRIATAIAVAQRSYAAQKAGAVVLARADGFADALGGTPLAVDKEAPLLLTPSGGALDPRVLTEVKRVLPAGKTVYVLGGPAALSTQVDQALVGAGYKVLRLQGVDRYATSVAIAHDGLGDPQIQLLATGLNFPDALAGGAAAAAVLQGGAVLLTNGSKLTPEVSAYLTQHPGSRYALGGPAAAVPATGATPLVGADRFATAVLVAQTFFPEANGALLASGANFPDALAGGALAGRVGAPLLLTQPGALPPSVIDYVARRRAELAAGIVLGGPVAVSDAVLAAFRWQLS